MVIENLLHTSTSLVRLSQLSPSVHEQSQNGKTVHDPGRLLSGLILPHANGAESRKLVTPKASRQDFTYFCFFSLNLRVVLKVESIFELLMHVRNLERIFQQIVLYLHV